MPIPTAALVWRRQWSLEVGDGGQTVAMQSRCWGGLMRDSDYACCSSHELGGWHFKDKFCVNCINMRISLPKGRVRAIGDGDTHSLANRRSQGVWNRAPLHWGGGGFRVVNNTAGCVKPALVVFSEEPPALDWLPMPEGWVNGGCVALVVSKGTLVPVPTLQRGSGAKRRATTPAAVDKYRRVRLRLRAPTLVAERASAASPCDDVNGPPPLSELGFDLQDVDLEATQSLRHDIRMRRNRESAAVSRERKRKHIIDLEAQVRNLEEQVAALQGENYLLRVSAREEDAVALVFDERDRFEF